jgi:hypothetical protein
MTAMPDEPDVVISLTLRADVADLLSALIDPGYGVTGLEGVIGTLVDHAWQGALRPASWERSWLCSAFGSDWIERLERDPDLPHHDRRRRDSDD